MCKNMTEVYSIDGERLFFSVVPNGKTRDRTRDSERKLKHKRSSLNIRKHFLV